MNAKRWVAIGIAIVLFFSSITFSWITNWILRDVDQTSFWDTFIGDQLAEQILEDGRLHERIAVLQVSGTILNTAPSFLSPGYQHEKLLSDLKTIENDPTVKAIILRVDSPGGGVYESAQLRDAIKAVLDTKEIPLYVVMESMAASGGYYISVDAHQIYATQETITGSIGVIMSGLNLSGLMEQFGVTDMTIKSGDLKDIGSSTRTATEKDLKVLQDLVDSMYERFVDVVVEGRGMARDTVYTLADGRIYDGSQALEVGLVDAIGYYEDALSDLKSTYGLEQAQVFRYADDTYGLWGSFLLEARHYMSKSNRSHLVDLDLSSGVQDQPGFMYLYKGVLR